MIDPFVHFLLDRIQEREEMARQATPGPWWNESGTVHAPLPYGRNDGQPGAACHPLDAQGRNGRNPDADAELAAYWNPVQVLAECRAHRQLLGFYVQDTPGTRGSFGDGLRVAIACMGLAHKDHPDYQPEWGP